MPSIVIDCYADMAQRLIDAQAEIEQLRKALREISVVLNEDREMPLGDIQAVIDKLSFPLAVTQQEPE